MKDYDNYTYTHSMNVGILSILIGIKMGYSQTILRDLAMCGILHDMGKSTSLRISSTKMGR
jgi:HD-GYP domain-containing protein (c-di-GMP phosphodiesterase class II)